MGVWLWTLIGRIALLALVPALVTLSGCWEWQVAGPLLGIGTVGTGVAIAEVEHSNKKQTELPATGQPENGSEAAVQPGNPQFAAKNNAAPVVGTIQESTLPATPKAVSVASPEKPVASTEKSVETDAEPYDEGVAVRSHRLVTNKHHSKTVPLPSSTLPSTLPTTVIVD